MRSLISRLIPATDQGHRASPIEKITSNNTHTLINLATTLTPSGTIKCATADCRNCRIMQAEHCAVLKSKQLGRPLEQMYSDDGNVLAVSGSILWFCLIVTNAVSIEARGLGDTPRRNVLANGHGVGVFGSILLWLSQR